MKYQSELIKEILDQRGHEKSSLHYESECVEEWIEECKWSYPKLCDYKGEWLNYIVENPIGKFPYETITDVSEATVNNVVPFAYKSAILKGSTKYRDIDTGEVLDAFEDGRNLELVSVRMPVLKTTGKNLFDGIMTSGQLMNNNVIQHNQTRMGYSSFVPVEEEINIYCSFSSDITTYRFEKIYFYDENKTQIGSIITPSKITTPKGAKYFRMSYTTTDWSSSLTFDEVKDDLNTQVEIGTERTSYEPYKSNILTVNEDVTLRSNGSVCDELDLLTGKLTQRIDEDGEILTQEVVKTVNLNITDQDGQTLSKIKPIEGTMHVQTDGQPIKPLLEMEVPVEATTQNLASFIEEG